MSSARISPTAYYTGQVWVREGFAGGEFATWQGRVLHALLAPSLRLIKSLTSDREISHVLFIGAYRDNEVNEAHPVSQVIDEVTLREMLSVGGASSSA